MKHLLFILLLVGLTHTAFGAASILISSPVLATNGRAITISTTCVVTCSPSSGITGFQALVTVGSFADPVQVTSVTASGTTITLTTAVAIQTGETLTLNLGTVATSNLTDGGGNTPTGQTGVAVTNNSTRTGVTGAGLANSNLYFLGLWSQVNGNTQPLMQLLGTASRLDFQCSACTDMEFQSLNGTVVAVTVDGGAPSNVTTPTITGNFAWASGASGLSNSTHTFSLTGDWIERSNSIRVSSSTGASLTPIVTYGPFTAVNASPFTTSGRGDASPFIGTSGAQGYVGVFYWNSSDGGIRFNATGITDAQIWTYNSGNSYVCYQDGVQVGSSVATTGTWNLAHVCTGLAGSGSHTYEIIPITSSDIPYIFAVMTLGGSGITGVQPASRQTILEYGDSIVVYTVCCSDMRQGDMWQVARPLGLADQHPGFSGSQVSTFLRDNAAANINLSPSPKVVILEGGVNDAINGVNVGTFQTAMQTMISNAAGVLPNTSIIIVRGIGPTTAVSAGTRTSYVNAQIAAVAAYMGGAHSVPAYFVSTDNWYNTGADTAGDGLHPSAAGYIKIANREIPLVAGYTQSPAQSYSLTGPSTGTAGTPSTNFTATLPGSATFTGDQTLTCASTNGSDVFAPSQPMTPTNGATNITFTVTPANGGSRTISCTNGQAAWVDPSGLSFTASSSSPVSTRLTGSTRLSGAAVVR